MSEDITNTNDQNGNEDTNDNPGGKQGGDGGQVTFKSQAALDAVIMERVRRAESSTTEKLTAEIKAIMGVEDFKQAAQIIEADAKAKQADLSELDKAQAANATLQDSLAKRESKYNAVLVNNAVILESPKHKVPTERIPALMKLMDTSTVSVKDGAVTGVEDAIKKAVEDNPFLLYQDQEADDSKGDGKLPPQGTNTTNQQRLRDQLGKVNEDDKKRKQHTPKYSM